MRRMPTGLLAAVFLGVLAAGPAYAADPLVPFDRSADSSRPERMRISPQERAAAVGNVSGTAAFPGTNGNIVYARAPYLEWPASVWVMDPIGSGQTALTTGGIGQGDNLPAWSPGGTMVAFTRDTTSAVDDDAADIFVMRQDGAQLRRLTATSAAEYSPAWSPDGGRIAFTSNQSGNYEIYTMAIDGSDVRRLTFDAGVDDQPAWSPDGTRIAFASDRSGDVEIYSMTANGGGTTRLTVSGGIDFEPAWSPDGSKIAFSSTRTGDYEIFTMSGAGSGPVNLTKQATSWEFNPAWSPDGQYIAYDGDQYGDLDVFVIYAGGGTPTVIAFEYDDEWAADWQPIPAFPLVDARFSMFKSDIEWAFDAGITSGCSAERYCADDSVTREQMASFLARALVLPSTATDFFGDDETSIHEVDINRVAAAGITSGCAAGSYCPKSVVTREQMASFLARALDLPSTTTDFFSDDEASIHEVDINRVAAAGITTGCTATTYCPHNPVTRGQMAAFLHRALD